VPDPFRSDPEARLYRTGDLARFCPDGSLEYLSRIDSQVKIRGFRIELGEIESVLSEHASVKECVAAVREDKPGDVRLVGYIVPRGGTEVNVADLRSHLRTMLPEYMVPQHFIELAELPLTPAGKVDRKHLPTPDSDDFLSASEYVAPRDTIELQLTKLWEKHLGITPISVNDNFFDIGGHSLLAVQLFTEIEKAIGKRLPLAILFQAPSISELASIIRQKDWKPNWSSLVAIQPGGSKPPLFLAHGGGGNVLLYRDLARNLGKDQPVYGLQSQGLNSKQELLTTIEEMAAYYITEIRTLQPKGPYYLGGYCLGGQIAFEIARQLVNANQKVLFVGMFDTHREWVQNLSRITCLHQYYQNIAFHFKNFLLANNQGKKAFIKEKCFESLRRIKRRIDVSISIVCFRMNLRNERPLAIMEHINDKAAQQYVAKPYSGRITLFQPKRPYADYEDPYYGWNDNFADTIDIQKLTMYPAGMLVEPFVQELTDKLSVCLEQARQDSNPVKLNAGDVKRKV
jgi:thioesterase domain-containing protein/acyl carrier protein